MSTDEDEGRQERIVAFRRRREPVLLPADPTDEELAEDRQDKGWFSGPVRPEHVRRCPLLTRRRVRSLQISATVKLGVIARGSLHLVRTARARAARQGRDSPRAGGAPVAESARYGSDRPSSRRSCAKLQADICVVVRLFDQTLAQRLEGSFDIHRALSMSALAAPAFASAALGESLLGSFSVADQLLMLGDLEVDRTAGLTGMIVAQVAAERGVRVLAKKRSDTPLELVPPPTTMLAPGDRLTVLGSTAAWDALAPPGHQSVRGERLRVGPMAEPRRRGGQGRRGAGSTAGQELSAL